jgi:branched-chain amino acid transport system permease protein
MAYAVHVGIMIDIFIMLAISLDLVAGQLGALSMAHAAFYGVGAYSCALIAVRLGGGFLVGVVAGIGAAALLSLMISLPSLRLHGDFLVIATFGFQILAFDFFNNMVEFTGGPSGVTNIPALRLLGFVLRDGLPYLGFTSALALGTYFLAELIKRSPFGRVLRAIREDERFAESIGKSTLSFKVKIFAVSAGLAALAGGCYAYYVSYIDPTSFTVGESVLMIAMVIIGGAGSAWGAVLGAVVLVSLPELLRLANLSSSVAANMREIIYGLLLVVTMAFRPRGLVGSRDFG